jgi:hypothetical protein
MDFTVKLGMPVMPNFLRIEMPPGRREDGFKEGPSISVADLTDEQVEQFIAEWGEAFRTHVAMKRRTKDDPIFERKASD